MRKRVIYMKDREITVKPFFVRCVIIEAITVAAILIAVFIITLISPDHTYLVAREPLSLKTPSSTTKKA